MPKDSSQEREHLQTASLGPEMRKIVLAGVKFLLARLKQNNVTEVLGVREDFVWALDESVADMSLESLPILVRLKMPFLKIFMGVF